MADLFILWVYIAGAVTDWETKRGFWRRVTWPFELGEQLYFWVRDGR